VETLILIGIWLLGIYFIKMQMEIKAYKKHLNQHKDIYVPSYTEMMKTNHWTIQLTKYLLREYREMREDNLAKKVYNSIKNNESVPVLALASQERSHSTLNYKSEEELRSVA